MTKPVTLKGTCGLYSTLQWIIFKQWPVIFAQAILANYGSISWMGCNSVDNLYSNRFETLYSDVSDSSYDSMPEQEKTSIKNLKIWWKWNNHNISLDHSRQEEYMSKLDVASSEKSSLRVRVTVL